MAYQTFKLKKEHVLLLQHSYIDWWCAEAGSAAINCKRPYGNSDHLKDMCEILGVKRKLDLDKTEAEGEIVYDEKQEEWLESLHRETESALKIILKTKSFKPGLYQADRDDDNWKLVKK